MCRSAGVAVAVAVVVVMEDRGWDFDAVGFFKFGDSLPGT